MYSALFGSYEKLNEQPVADKSDLRFVCFTDNPTLESDTWELHVVKPRFPWDPTRSARELKILGHPEILEYRTSLWIDNRVQLAMPPELFLPTFIRDAEISLPLHSFRETVREEFYAVLQHGFDRAERVREQLHHMTTHQPEVLTQQPYWTAILARQHGPSMQDAMTDWMFHVLRHSRRDQLSVNAILNRSSLTVNALALDNFTSEYHTWLGVKKDEKILKDRSFIYPLSDDIRDRWLTSRAHGKTVGARRRLRAATSRGKA
ncbi:glycosyltransferase domain-containing protein [Aeromicrobium fastidiosum]|uniref:glycosyltransferase domain-containing protein n=1 Tax=Aeromicrobium fastidiosum TaxID=52699 RepID=UPI0020235904|nr:glycosyltransferase domain-containing protein [Aeromicrobium fastidiosum]